MNNSRGQNGEGTIIQVSESKWLAKIRMGTDASGKHLVKQFSGQSEATVKKKLREFKRSQDFLGRRMPSNDTVSSYFSRWLREYQHNKLKPSSYDRLESTVLNHIIPNRYELKTQKSTKTTNGNRVIPINQSAERALLKLKADNATPYIIINSRQKLVLPGDLERSFHVVLKNAGIDGNHGIHVLRHTFASMLFSKGIDVKIVSQLLGHSTVKITYDTCVHLFEKDIARVTNVLD